MAVRNQFNVWAQARHSGTTESICDRTTGAAGREGRVGAEADDAILVRAALVGQVWAQREIWFRFAPMVSGLFRRTLCPRHDQDDLTQEVFLRVFSRLHTLERVSAIRSFVFSVAVRVVSEEVHRFAWRRRIIEHGPDLSMLSTSSPADFEARETLLCVQRSLDGLRDKHRAVFILRYVNRMELREIGLGLGISHATVKRYLAKALASICKFVAKEEGERRTRFGTSTASRLFGGGR